MQIKLNLGINLLYVALHEFGHSLGLEHSTLEAAVMTPFYPGYNPNLDLHYDDISRIQVKYSGLLYFVLIWADNNQQVHSTVDGYFTI